MSRPRKCCCQTIEQNIALYFRPSCKGHLHRLYPPPPRLRVCADTLLGIVIESLLCLHINKRYCLLSAYHKHNPISLVVVVVVLSARVVRIKLMMMMMITNGGSVCASVCPSVRLSHSWTTRHLVNDCEVKAHLIGCWQNLGAVCFWQPIPSGLNLVVAVLRNSLRVVSLLPCVADLYVVYHV